MANELQKLQDLFDMGFIQAEEFDLRRKELTGTAASASVEAPTPALTPLTSGICHIII